MLILSRIRRVKCDEGKPVCARCSTTGRVCDGYGIWGGGGNSYAERYGSPKSQSPSPITIERGLTKAIGVQELRHLQWFRMKVIHTVSGWFGSQFWAKVALPATSTEPAILHAVIALSAAHMCEFHPWQAPDARERFVLQQYSKAINLLQSVLLHRDKTSIAVVLIVCQVFTFLEYLRGKHKLAETHLRNGLRLLKDLYTEESMSYHGVVVLKPASHAKVLDHGIVRSFATMHLQADLFGRHLAGIDMILQPMETEVPFPTFANVEEAKDCLDKLLHGILLISQKLRENRDGFENDWSRFDHAQEQAMSLLQAWLETYYRTTVEMKRRILLNGNPPEGPLAFGTKTPPSTKPITREPIAYKLLLSYHAMATIMCNCLRADSESAYEAHTTEFMIILEGSIELWKAYLLALSVPNNVKLSDSISEFGFLPPLYYTALKCRNHRIRLHAIRLLSQIPHKEGVWDSNITASVGRKVMRLEEAEVSRGMDFDFDDEFPLEVVPDLDAYCYPKLPESSLFHEVQVDLQEEPANSAVLTCKRWQVDGNLEVLKCHFDGRRWTNIP
ncbi:hypothetical protein N0V83_009104 [Neocucurbitaria cava]|uniref:Zn(2)-C6 fungal-type domain-containing protein n=1 Tax=Neocucurbitaria cava TaxID=798079 RepID=A0A9W8Y0G8_9PLEO|nr:hypothetical protein N0V83_009104 [Neocucurbitaria cava]